MQKQTEGGLFFRGPLCIFHINKSVIVPILFVGFYPFHAIILSFYLTVYDYSNIEGYYRGTCHVMVLYLTAVTKELWLLFAYYLWNIDRKIFLQMACENI